MRSLRRRKFVIRTLGVGSIPLFATDIVKGQKEKTKDDGEIETERVNMSKLPPRKIEQSMRNVPVTKMPPSNSSVDSTKNGIMKNVKGARSQLVQSKQVEAIETKVEPSQTNMSKLPPPDQNKNTQKVIETKLPPKNNNKN